VNGTVVPAASTIYFIDGANSESRAVTAGGGSSTLTVAATSFAHNANTPIYWQLTASLGPAFFTPVTNVSFQDHIAFIADTGVRGSNVSSYNQTPAAMYAEVSIDGDVFTDAFGFMLGSVYGAVDFSAGTPNTHTFAGMNTSASNGQPTPMLLFVFDGFNVRMFAGAKCSEVAVKFDVTTNLSYTSKWTSLSSSVVASYTPTFTTVTPQGAWQAAASINSVTLPNVLSADFTVGRDAVDAIQTLDGQQQATVVWVGALNTSGNMNLTMEDDSQLSIFTTAAAVPVSFTLTNGTGATQSFFQLQMTKCFYTDGWKPQILGGKGYVEIGGPVMAEGNTTDANTAGGGYSPSRAVLKNSLPTATFQ
jgi:hypothetical protein